MHGMVISSRYMVPTALELAPLCPVYAVDLPGYGDSVKPHSILDLPELADALAAWMDAMRFPAAHLVANSFGCQVLAEFALRHAHRMDRLVFQGPTVKTQIDQSDVRAEQQPLALQVSPGWPALDSRGEPSVRKVAATACSPGLAARAAPIPREAIH